MISQFSYTVVTISTWISSVYLSRRNFHILQKSLIVVSVIPRFIKLFVYFVGLLILLHYCEKHISIPLFFVIDISIHYMDILKYHPGEPRVDFLCLILDETWNFYHTCLGFSFLSLWFPLFFIYPFNDSTGIPLCIFIFNCITNP